MDAIERRILVDGVVCTCSAVVRARLLGWMDRGRGALLCVCYAGVDRITVVLWVGATDVTMKKRCSSTSIDTVSNGCKRILLAHFIHLVLPEDKWFLNTRTGPR